MDNGSTGVPQFEVPRQPGVGAQEMPPVNPNYAPQPAQPEVLPQQGNMPGTPVPMPPVPPVAMPSQSMPSVPQPMQHAQPMAPPITANLTAEDADLIEKEWVEKAKEIVERTRHDPYLQNREITKMKADYMKKRYNKDIKVPEN